MGEDICPFRSACLLAEPATGSVRMEEKGIHSLAARTERVTARYQRGTSLHWSYIPRLHVTDQPGHNTLKEKKLQYFESILRASGHRCLMWTLDKVFIPQEPLLGKSSLQHCPRAAWEQAEMGADRNGNLHFILREHVWGSYRAFLYIGMYWYLCSSQGSCLLFL